MINLEKVLITCDENNIPSKKVIEKNGGEFESRIFNGEKDTWSLRYWITLEG